MRHIGLVLGLAAAVAAIGSGDAAAKGNTAKPPAELLVSVSRGPATGLDGLRAFANEIKPGAGMMISDTMIDSSIAPMIGATSLAGLDRASASYLLYVDGNGVKGLAYVGKVADDTAFTNAVGQAFVVKKNGWAVFGAKPVVDKVSAYALSTLVAQPNVTAPVATAYVPNVLARYKAQIAVMRTQALAGLTSDGVATEFKTKYVDGILSTLGQTDQLTFAFDASKDGSEFDIALRPKAGSTLAKFVAAQKPSDYALVNQLPDLAAPMLIAGHLEAGPYRQDLLQMVGVAGSMPKEVIDLYKTVLQASSGDAALVMGFAKGKGMSMTGVFAMTNPKAADAAIARIMGLLAKGLTMTTMGMTQTLTAVAGPTVHDGVTVRGYDTTMDLSKAPPAMRASSQLINPSGTARSELAVVDKLYLVAMGSDADAQIGRAIDIAHGKGVRAAMPKPLAAMLASSQARKDSGAMMFDFAALAALTGTPAKMTGQVLMTFGVVDRAAHFRVRMPSSMFKQFTP
ncbi:MAG: hypothetical protein K8W52_17480 [Deltaproteobacteria bacterium]|nr:hypothetical protein [Deltaproteobacteria bacterium]